jgi:hypothetical protein
MQAQGREQNQTPNQHVSYLHTKSVIPAFCSNTIVRQVGRFFEI